MSPGPHHVAISADRATPATRAARLAPVLVALLTFVAFLPALRNGFVSWDDRQNFLQNPHYRGLGPAQLGWMWSTFHLGHYVPLAWMSLGLDYVLWGMNAVGYHFTSLVLHTANAVVLYFIAHRLLARLRTPPISNRFSPTAVVIAAAFAALLFAVHPLRVESVAWVTERRDVLSLLFYLLSVLSYIRMADGGAHSTRAYWLSFGAFACALLSKGTAMTLPALLLLLDVFPLARIGGARGWRGAAARRVYAELAPFVLLSAAAIVLSIVALHPPEQLSPVGKAAVSAYSLAFYLWKTIAPVGLSPLYEMPQQVDPGAGRFVVGYAVTISVLALALVLRRRRPVIAAAVAAFTIATLPMLGVVQNGFQIAADRYTYHGAPALAILAAAGMLALWRIDGRARIAVGAAFIIALGALTWRQTGVWHDSERLWRHALSLDSSSAIAHSALARLLYEQDRVSEAMEHSRRAIAIAPRYPEGHNDLAVGLAREGHVAEAIDHYRRALALRPSYDEARTNLGVMIVRQGDLEGGVAHFRQAIATNPDNADAHVNWGNALVRFGNPSGAIPHYRQAVTIRVDHADAHHNWGVALAQQGKFTEAVEQFRIALTINPRHGEARRYLEQAMALAIQKR